MLQHLHYASNDHRRFSQDPRQALLHILHDRRLLRVVVLCIAMLSIRPAPHALGRERGHELTDGAKRIWSPL